MKRIRPDYYDKFACIADQCSITCCQEWKIGVDADTNRKWKKIFPPEDVLPQKKNLSAYTTEKDGQLSSNNFQNGIEQFFGSQTVSSILPPFRYDVKSGYPSFRTI